MNSIRSQLKSMLAVEARPGGFRATLSLRADLSILADHFANAPILPGMCLVQAVLVAAAIAADQPNLQLAVLKNAKLMQPIFPGEQVLIDADMALDPQGQFIIKAKVTGDAKRRADVSLTARLPIHQSGPARSINAPPEAIPA